MHQPPPQIPVFELPLVLLPSERVPLHIFEDRYRRMIRHCLAEDAPFGVLLRTDDGVADIGCAATVTEVIEEFEDGRMNIVVEGEYRFRVTGRLEGPGFPLAEITRIEDDLDDPADPEPVRESFAQLLAALESDATLDDDAGTAFEIAARVEIPVEAKQKLLACNSEADRLVMLERILDGLRDRVERSRDVAERARSNGHGPITGLSPPER